MEDLILKYKNGDRLAEELLLDRIVGEFSHSIDKAEARILLHKKYGKAEKF